MKANRCEGARVLSIPIQNNMATGLRVFLPLLIALVAYIYLRNRNEKVTLERVLKGLLKGEQSVNISRNIRVAVGFGSCMDIIVDGLTLLEKLGYQPPDEVAHHDLIKDEQKFRETFAYFMKEGAAAEYVIHQYLLPRHLFLLLSKWSAVGVGEEQERQRRCLSCSSPTPLPKGKALTSFD